MIQLINLKDYFQGQSKNKQYLHAYISKDCLSVLQKPVKSIYNNSNLNLLLQKYLLNEQFIIPTNNYRSLKINNSIFDCAPAYVNRDICQHLFNHSYGNLNDQLLLYKNKPIFLRLNKNQTGGKREYRDYWHIYNYKARIHPFFVDFALRAGLSTLWWNRFFLNFYPIEPGIKETLRKLIDMVRKKKHPVGKMYRFFYGDWFLTRVRKVSLWFMINVLRLIPEPVTQSVANSISFNSIDSEIKESSAQFSSSLRKLTSGSDGPFSGFPALQEFFESSSGSFPLKAKKELIQKLRPKEVKYQIMINGQPETRSVILMNDVDHIYSYLKEQLDEFLEDDPYQFNKLINNIDRVFEKMTNLLSSMITAVTQYDCGIAGFFIQIVAQKSRPDVVVMLIKQIFNVIPTNLRKILLDPNQLGHNIKYGLRGAVDKLKKFPDSLESFFKENIPSIEESKAKEIIRNIKSSIPGKDTFLDIIDRNVVINIEVFIDLFYLVIPLILIFSIIRGYSTDSKEQAIKDSKKSDQEKKMKEPRMGLITIQNHALNIWLIESKKLIDQES